MGSSKFSPGAVAAVVAAQIEDGLTARQAADAASRGELPGFTGTLSISESSARSWAGRARREARVEHPDASKFADVAVNAAERLARIVTRQMDALEAADAPDADAVTKWCRAARELDRLARAVARPTPGRAKPEAPARDDDAEDFLASL